MARAHNIYKRRPPQGPFDSLPSEKEHGQPVEKLIHSLLTHEIELSMQNDELLRSQMMLEESRRKYASLYDFAPIGYVTVNEKSIILEANLTVAGQLGVERRRLVNTPFAAAVAMGDRDIFLAHLKDVFTIGEHSTCEVRLMNGDGDQLYALLDSILIGDEEDVPACRTSIIDISRRRRAELALRQAHDTLERRVVQRTAELKNANQALRLEMEERGKAEKALQLERDRFFTILESMKDPVHIFSTQYDIEYLNSAARQIFGHAEGLKWQELFRANREACPACPGAGALRGETVEWVWTTPLNGRTYEIWNAPLENADGTTSRLQIMHDITEQKQAMRALSESETEHRRLSREFGAVLNAISDTLVLLSPQMEVLWANKGGMRSGDGEGPIFVGRKCYEALYGLSQPCEDCPAAKCIATGRNEAVIVSHGDVVEDKRAFPIKDGERIHSILLLIRDITEMTTLQAETMRAAHLASLGELAAGVAHEINNPITGIINYAQILIDEALDDERETDVPRRIMKEGERIAAIVRSLLASARVGGEARSPAQISDIISESIVLTQAQLRKEGIGLEVKISSDIPEVDVNFQQIQQAFLNIINNARYALNKKYNGRHENKRLVIRGKKILLDNCEYARIVFRDSGTGFPEALRPKIGRPFFTTKPFGKGTGLGLFITLKIVADHAGKITIDSMEGEYTSVIVDLPARV